MPAWHRASMCGSVDPASFTPTSPTLHLQYPLVRNPQLGRWAWWLGEVASEAVAPREFGTSMVPPRRGLRHRLLVRALKTDF